MKGVALWVFLIILAVRRSHHSRKDDRMGGGEKAGVNEKAR